LIEHLLQPEMILILQNDKTLELDPHAKTAYVWHFAS